MAQALGGGGYQVELKNVVLSAVKPSERTAHAEKHDAALFDLYLPDFYMPVLMLFRPDREALNRLSASEFVSSIKHSLSRVLVPYYTFAGRVRTTYDLSIRELVCNDEGVPFIEGDIDEEMEKVVNIDDFQPMAVLSGYEFLNFDPFSFYQENATNPLPACFIQVTKFKCGGISVHVSFLHMVGDGKAMFQFLKDWSQMTLDDQISFERIHDRSLTYDLSVLLDMVAANGTSTESESDGPVTTSENLEVQHEISQNRKKRSDEALPVDDRCTVDGAHDQINKLDTSLQNIGSTGFAPGAPPVTNTTNPKGEEHVEQMQNGTNGNNAGADAERVDLGVGLRFGLMPEAVRKTLHVKKESVQKLKEEAKRRNLEFVPTALDCMQSHMWRGLCSIPSSVDGRGCTIYGVVAEGRQRLHDPPLPDSYSGNVILLIYTDPLEKPSDDPLVEASVIHKIVQSISPQSWQAAYTRAVSVLSTCTTSDERTFFVTSWYRFPLYEVEFGYGKPILSTMNGLTSAAPAGFAVVMPPRPGSDDLASIQFTMAPQMLEAMLADSEFLSFFR